MGKYCVLIVDDQKDSTSILTTMLERRDFECFHAANIEEANKKLEELAPHLLIVDVHLGPNENGIAWLTEIRKGPFGFIPAIVLTSAGDEETVRTSIHLGIDDFVLKPLDSKVIAKKIVALQAKLDSHVFYSFNAIEPIPVEATHTLRISAISETGFCLSSHIANRLPISFTNPVSTLFQEMEISPLKKITMMNYERETSWKSQAPMRNFCQANGWTEPDFKRVRLWIRRNKLGRSF